MFVATTSKDLLVLCEHISQNVDRNNVPLVSPHIMEDSFGFRSHPSIT